MKDVMRRSYYYPGIDGVEVGEPEDCVKRGAAFLDCFESGWEDSIDLQELDIFSTTHCILGQFGEVNFDPHFSYRQMLELFRLDDDLEPALLGFNCGRNENGELYVSDKLDLEIAWTKEVLARRN